MERRQGRRIRRPGWIEGEPYLDQLAVRVAAMRRGVGGRLLARAADWAHATGGSTLGYNLRHLPLIGPTTSTRLRYMPESDWPPGIRQHIDAQRRTCRRPTTRRDATPLVMDGGLGAGQWARVAWTAAAARAGERPLAWYSSAMSRSVNPSGSVLTAPARSQRDTTRIAVSKEVDTKSASSWRESGTKIRDVPSS